PAGRAALGGRVEPVRLDAGHSGAFAPVGGLPEHLAETRVVQRQGEPRVADDGFRRPAGHVEAQGNDRPRAAPGRTIRDEWLAKDSDHIVRAGAKTVIFLTCRFATTEPPRRSSVSAAIRETTSPSSAPG